MTDDWLILYTQKGVALERLDDGTVRWIGRRRTPSFDLAGVPGGESIEIRIENPNSPRVTLTGGRAGHRVIIRQPIDVVVQGGRVGTVVFDLSAGLPRRNDASLQGEADEVCAARGKVRIDADIGRLVLAGGAPKVTSTTSENS